MAVDILLVDDQPSNLVVLEAVLARQDWNLVKARSGSEALRFLLDRDFALILMDAQMPGMDGFETAALIRQRPRTRHTPIIFLTAYDRSDAEVFRGYAVGAVDFLIKPFIPEVLRTKVSVFVDLHRKTEEVRRQAELLRETEKRELERRLVEERQRFIAEQLQQELRLAQEIQRRLFPRSAPQVPGLDVYGASVPAEATGGDYYDYLPLAGGALGIAVGDVCGHGLGPALLMAATRAYLRALVMAHENVGEILQCANRALAADVAEGHFVTLVLARIDPETRTLTYASAGHNPFYVVGADGEVKAALESTGPPLGVVPDAEFPEGEAIALESGDSVILLTDGIAEANGPDGEPFGIERALEQVRADRSGGARAVVDGLCEAVRAYAGATGPSDDVTGVVVQLGARSARGKNGQREPGQLVGSC